MEPAHDGDRPSITIDRATGPRITQSPPRSLGDVVVSRTGTAMGAVSSAALTVGGWLVSFIQSHTSVLVGAGLHMVVLAALILPNYQRAPYDPPASYAGPGNINASAAYWYGFRCYDAA